MNNNISLILFGILDKDINKTEKILKYYKNIIPNIILITFEYLCNKSYFTLLNKYIKKDNLILIPSNKDGNNINKKVLICPFNKTRPNLKFYCDSDWFEPSTNFKNKGFNFRKMLYKYFTTYNKKFEYYLILRLDIFIEINEFFINELKKNNNNKITLNSLNYIFHKNYNLSINDIKLLNKCFSKDKDYLENFLSYKVNNTKQRYKIEPKLGPYCSLSFMYSNYETLYNFFIKNYTNINYNYNYPIASNSECWFISHYLIKKEGLQIKNKIQEITNKYFNFIKLNNLSNNICNTCWSLSFGKQENNNIICLICKKNINI